MFRFLEREGAQVLVEPIGSWVMYMLHQGVQKAGDRKGLDVSEEAIPAYRLDQKLKAEWSGFKAASRLAIAAKLFAREYHKIANGFEGLVHTLVDQREIARLGAPFYNTRAEGGEGHMEVGKTIYYTENKLCHMVLSLKPFGCMPSTQSDGAQAKVMAIYSDLIYLPIETSGEGEVNAHSRVQMALAEAKSKARKEFAEVLERTGLTLEECRSFIEKNPEMKKSTYVIPHFPGIVGSAANTVMHISQRIRSH
jgi:predicted nucleotide-binding protein (sugar kinase/HSP70/actin superfamily)